MSLLVSPCVCTRCPADKSAYAAEQARCCGHAASDCAAALPELGQLIETARVDGKSGKGARFFIVRELATKHSRVWFNSLTNPNTHGNNQQAAFCCVTARIRAAFPDPNGIYTGYHSAPSTARERAAREQREQAEREREREKFVKQTALLEREYDRERDRAWDASDSD